MTFNQLKARYFSRPSNRASLIEQFWVYFEVESMRAYEKYYRRLSNLSIKADFCLALDAFLRSGDDVDCFGFESIFSREMRLDLESSQPIKHHLKKIMGRGAVAVSFPEDHNVSHTRMIYDLDYVNCCSKPPRGIDVGVECSVEGQVFKLMKDEVRLFMTAKYGRVIYEDWLSHFVYGESLRALAIGRGLSHEAIRLRVIKAKVGLKHFLKEY